MRRSHPGNVGRKNHGLVQVEDATLYSRPDYMPKIIGAAITPETAEWVGG